MDDERTEILGSQNIALGGPFKLEMQVHLICESGEHKGCDAWATIDLPPGEVPNIKQIEDRLASALKEAGSAFRLATRKEFVSGLLSERVGFNMNFAIPGPDSFTLSPTPPA